MAAATLGPDRRCATSADLSRALATVDRLGVDAERFECEGVARGDVNVMAAAGILSAGITEALAPAQVREVHERLAPSSGALWFVMAQHRSPANAAASTANAELRGRYATALATGELLGAVSFAHLRRPRPSVVAERVEGGWAVSGRLDWVTSWGLADVLLLMAETPDGQVVQALLPAREREGLRVTGELALAAMQGTSTVGAVLDHLRIDDAEVADVLPKSEWLLHDTQRTANVPPAVVGLARAAVNTLAVEGSQRDWSQLSALAAQWRDQLSRDRDRAYGLIDDADPATFLDERRGLRASITGLAHDATGLLVATQGGRAMLTSSPAQRWAREVLFSLVQAQTPDTRAALVEAYGGG